MDDPRLDKLLWCLRVFRTRPEATEACRAGGVRVQGLPAKPGRDVHAGEVIGVRLRGMTRTLRVLALPRTRLGAKRLPEFVEDLTPPEEVERARQAATEHARARLRGEGRPSKKQRRDLEALFGPGEDEG